ncbi:MAG: hypothetical protein LC779_07730 [Actinobacteria bacterium]|nr:hypothetical protein [Actinomycetota bacterium]
MTTTSSGLHTDAATRSPGVDERHANSMAPADMRKRGIVLLVGAVVIALLVKEIGPLDYYWNPPLVGLVFLAAAAVTGIRSPLWGAGLVVGFWGAAKILQNNTGLAWTGAFTTVCIGLGGLLAAYLVTRGFAIGVASIAWPVVFIGVGQYIHGTYSGWPITAYTAGLAALYGVVEIVNASRVSAKAGASA